MARILVVDDEERICRFVARALAADGFEIDTAASGSQAVQQFPLRPYDLVILDLMLPGIDGTDVLRQILAVRPTQKVLVLSAVPEIGARVQCLELGAVDFLGKPFAVAELLARVRTRLREPGTGGGRWLAAGDVRLDLQKRTLTWHGDTRQLAHREFVLLCHLMQRAGQVCSREELLADVWGYTFDPGSNVVDVYVRRLRAKLGTQHIETVRNVGYCFVA